MLSRMLHIRGVLPFLYALLHSFVLVSIHAFASSPCEATNGAQLWQELRFNQDIAERRYFSLYLGNRFRGNFREWWYSELGTGITQDLGSDFSVTATAGILRLQALSDIVTTEYRPGLNFAWRPRVGAATFGFRLRNELRVRSYDEGRPQEETYRLRLQAKQSLPTGMGYSIFTSEEVLYGSTTRTWEQLRFFAGMKLPKWEEFTPTLSWGLFSNRRQGSDSFADAHVIQIAFIF